MPSTIDAALQRRLIENGFTEDQVQQMAVHGVQPVGIAAILDANLSRADLQRVFNIIASLSERLPPTVEFQLYPQENDIPTIATYIRDLCAEDKKRVIATYMSLSDSRYIFDMGRGYLQRRSVQAEPIS